MKLIYKVPEKTKYKNVREVLKVEFSISDRLLLKLKKLQKVSLNNNKVYMHHAIKSGDLIECNLDYEEDISNIKPAPIPLSIIYEDESYLVINKPDGIPVHPSMSYYTNSLSNGVRYYFDKIGLHKKIRPVNRLDKDTTGLVIFAKNEYIQECLIRQMISKNFMKKYIAVIGGHLKEKMGTICEPISRKENSIIERCVNENGETAITHYKVLNNSEIEKIYGKNIYNKKANHDFEIVECTLETGRTHQIRVHFAYINHPILGDALYGSTSDLIHRQALHCYCMSFIHPIYKNKVEYIAPIPDDLKKILE